MKIIINIIIFLLLGIIALEVCETCNAKPFWFFVAGAIATTLYTLIVIPKEWWEK